MYRFVGWCLVSVKILLAMSASHIRVPMFKSWFCSQFQLFFYLNSWGKQVKAQVLESLPPQHLWNILPPNPQTQSNPKKTPNKSKLRDKYNTQICNKCNM